jgi:hypothetical protein
MSDDGHVSDVGLLSHKTVDFFLGEFLHNETCSIL